VPGVHSVRLYQVQIPLRRPFKHAVAERAVADNVVCQVTLDDGTEGWGEGVPRGYVTGETPETCFREFSQRGRGLLACRAETLDELIGWLNDRTLTSEATAAGPPPVGRTDEASRYLPYAYRCACETALLDAFGHALHFSLSDVVTRVARPDDLQPRPFVQYSAVISSAVNLSTTQASIAFRAWINDSAAPF